MDFLNNLTKQQVNLGFESPDSPCFSPYCVYVYYEGFGEEKSTRWLFSKISMNLSTILNVNFEANAGLVRSH